MDSLTSFVRRALAVLLVILFLPITNISATGSWEAEHLIYFDFLSTNKYVDYIQNAEIKKVCKQQYIDNFYTFRDLDQNGVDDLIIWLGYTGADGEVLTFTVHGSAISYTGSAACDGTGIALYCADHDTDFILASYDGFGVYATSYKMIKGKLTQISEDVPIYSRWYVVEWIGSMPLAVEANIEFARMVLGNELAMQFAFRQSCIQPGYDYGLFITKTYADGRANKVVEVPQWEWKTTNIGGVPYYYVTFDGIAAKEMGDEIQVQIVSTGGMPAGDLYTTSVSKYALDQMRKTSVAETRTLYVDMLNYGAAAQTYFDYDTKHLVNASLTAAEKRYATTSVRLTNRLVEGTGYNGSQLNLANSIQLRTRFTNINASMYAIISFTNHTGRKIEARVEGAEFLNNGTTVVVDDVVAADYNCDVTIKVYNSKGKQVANAVDSVASYLARQINKENNSAIYDAVAKYCASAYSYLHRSDPAPAVTYTDLYHQFVTQGNFVDYMKDSTLKSACKKQFSSGRNYMSNWYCFYDMDQNGTDELLVWWGDGEAKSELLVFTYTNKEIRHLGSQLYGDGHGIYTMYNNTQPGIITSGYAGNFDMIYYLAISNDQLKITKNYKTSIFEWNYLSDICQVYSVQ